MEKDSCNPVGASVSRGGGTNARPRSMPSRSGTSGCANTRLRVRPTSTSISRCRRSPGQRCPADLLVYRLHCQHGGAEEQGQQYRGRQGHAAVAHGPFTPWPVLGGRLAARLPGHRFLDAVQVHPGRPQRKAAWLYAQFVVSKTVDVKKSHVGLTFIRNCTVSDKSFTERAPKLGGLVEFYRSPDRVAWTPTGVNVPDYPKLAQLFWENIGDVNSGAFTPQQAMDRLAAQMDQVMARMQAGRRKATSLPRLRSTPEHGEGSERMAQHGPRTVGQARQREAQGRDDRL